MPRERELLPPAVPGELSAAQLLEDEQRQHYCEQWSEGSRLGSAYQLRPGDHRGDLLGEIVGGGE